MNNLFQQKQRELVMAASKVEELNRQLELLKNGKMDNFQDNQSSVAELDRLYKELQVCRDKTKSQQSSIDCSHRAELCPSPCCPAEEQAEPGPELQAAAAEREPEQAQPGGGVHGQADQRAPGPAAQEEGGAAAEGEPARKFNAPPAAPSLTHHTPDTFKSVELQLVLI